MKSTPPVSPGRIVSYSISAADAVRINESISKYGTDFVTAGMQFPLLVSSHTGQNVCGFAAAPHALLYAKDVPMGDTTQPGTWRWPAREYRREELDAAAIAADPETQALFKELAAQAERPVVTGGQGVKDPIGAVPTGAQPMTFVDNALVERLHGLHVDLSNAVHVNTSQPAPADSIPIQYSREALALAAHEFRCGWEAGVNFVKGGGEAQKLDIAIRLHTATAENQRLATVNQQYYTENNVLRQINADLCSRLKRLDDEVDRLNAEIATGRDLSRARAAEAENEINGLRNDVRQAEEQYEKMRAQWQEAGDANTEAMAQLTRYQQECRRWEQTALSHQRERDGWKTNFEQIDASARKQVSDALGLDLRQPVRNWQELMNRVRELKGGSRALEIYSENARRDIANALGLPVVPFWTDLMQQVRGLTGIYSQSERDRDNWKAVVAHLKERVTRYEAEEEGRKAFPFAAGDVVRLKSGGGHWTVADVMEYSGTASLVRDNADGVACMDVKHEALTLVEELSKPGHVVPCTPDGRIAPGVTVIPAPGWTVTPCAQPSAINPPYQPKGGDVFFSRINKMSQWEGPSTLGNGVEVSALGEYVRVMQMESESPNVGDTYFRLPAGTSRWQGPFVWRENTAQPWASYSYFKVDPSTLPQ